MEPGADQSTDAAPVAVPVTVKQLVWDVEVTTSATAPMTVPKFQPFKSCVSFRITELLGGHTDISHPRAGSAQPRLVEFPTMDELRAMSRQQLQSFHFSKIALKARGGLDGMQFWTSDGRESPFYGACPSLNGSADRFGDVRHELKHFDLSGKGSIRAIDVFWCVQHTAVRRSAM